MDFYADVLDHTGRIPREFGSHHLHVETVTRGPWGNAVAALWLQGAFEPLPPSDASVVVMARQKTGLTQKMLGQFTLPRLEGGRVVRWRLPLSVPAEFDELHFEVSSKLHPKAERVRPAWKLMDTIEQPRESVLKGQPVSPEFGINVTRSVVGTVLSGGLSLSVSVGLGASGEANLREAVRVTRHAAAPSPTAFIAAVVDGAVEPLSEPQAETIWSPGMPLPEASVTPAWQPAPAAPAARPKDTRTCYTCYFEGPSDTYSRATMCPMCDAPWN